MKSPQQAVVLVMCLFSCGCKDEATPPPPPPPYVPTIQLSVEDASCTEAWLKVKLTDSAEPRTVAIQQDGQRVVVFSLRSPDSVFVVESLLPRRTYSFVAQRLRDSTAIDGSAPAQATTMDTSSHAFQFELDTLGVTASSLSDVAIINDTLAYAVGEIYLRDSTGQVDPILYNLAVWNGRRWSIRRVTVTFRGNQVTVPLEGVFALSATDIWLAGSIPIHGNGSTWVGYDIQALVGAGATVSKMWGTNSEMYFVGRVGNIIRYASATWQRVESGMTLPIMDVYGAPDRRTGRYQILCVSADQALPGHSQILSIENMTASEVYTNPLWEPWSIWFVPNRRYITAGDGLWEAHTVLGPWVRNNTLPALFKTCIDGLALNDVVVGGAFQLLAHWNGVHWQTFFPRNASSGFVGVHMRGNLMVAVGGVGDRALTLIGRR